MQVAEGEPESTARYQFRTPRFEGTVQLNARQSLAVLAGQRRVVTLADSHATILQYFRPKIRRWLTDLLHPAGV